MTPGRGDGPASPRPRARSRRRMDSLCLLPRQGIRSYPFVEARSVARWPWPHGLPTPPCSLQERCIFDETLDFGVGVPVASLLASREVYTGNTSSDRTGTDEAYWISKSLLVLCTCRRNK